MKKPTVSLRQTPVEAISEQLQDAAVYLKHLEQALNGWEIRLDQIEAELRVCARELEADL